jgi:RNA polymerase sigma factor (sigma-70 family)
MDFDDVKQMIYLHIHKKIHQYDPQREFSHWCNTIITNQIKNMWRNKYYAFSRPCLNCPYNLGNDLCEFTHSGKQDNECPAFQKWGKTRKRKYDVNFPLSTENHVLEMSNIQDKFTDIEHLIPKLHQKMKMILKANEWKCYEALYIKNIPEEEVAEMLGWTSNEDGRKRGYKRILQFRRIFIDKAKKLLKKEDLI